MNRRKFMQSVAKLVGVAAVAPMLPQKTPISSKSDVEKIRFAKKLLDAPRVEELLLKNAMLEMYPPIFIPKGSLDISSLAIRPGRIVSLGTGWEVPPRVN